jgi:hypothetical protein
MAYLVKSVSLGDVFDKTILPIFRLIRRNIQDRRRLQMTSFTRAEAQARFLSG